MKIVVAYANSLLDGGLLAYVSHVVIILIPKVPYAEHYWWHIVNISLPRPLFFIELIVTLVYEIRPFAIIVKNSFITSLC
jgi:hypothetical protein